MAMYCTVAEARSRQRVDSYETDADVQAFIEQASEAIRLHLRPFLPWQPELDSNGDDVLDSSGNIVYALDSSGDRFPRPAVTNATLYLLGCFFKDRDGQDPELWLPSTLPAAVLSMLTMLRDPILR